jgi:Rrf2 family protein
MCTRKAAYALGALTALAPYFGKDVFISAPVIAEAEGIPKRFCESILRDLKCAGFVRSERGTDGGFQLVRPPDQITVAEVILAIDGRIGSATLSGLLDPSEADGDAEGERASMADHNNDLRELFGRVREAMVEILSSVTIADRVALRAPRD